MVFSPIAAGEEVDFMTIHDLLVDSELNEDEQDLLQELARQYDLNLEKVDPNQFNWLDALNARRDGRMDDYLESISKKAVNDDS